MTAEPLLAAWAAFFLAYVLGNRLVAIPLGIVLGLPAPLVAGASILADLIQIALFDRIYHHGGRWLAFRRGADPSEPAKPKRPAAWIAHMGRAGVAVLAALPTFGGGVWSAVLLARSFRMSLPEKFAYIGGGALAGTLLVVAPSEGLIHFMRGWFS